MLSRGFTTMKKLNRYETQPAVSKHLFTGLLLAATLIVAGCDGERDANDGQNITQVLLPTDVVLNLYCPNVGIADETCVLDDPENPFASTFIPENEDLAPGDPSKFDMALEIPSGPSGAKARFYFWATALAQRQNGENQYFTALALHELYTANSNALSVDTLIQEHALRAYRSVLDNFFGSVWVQICFECAPRPDGEFPRIPLLLNETVADHLYRTMSTANPPLQTGGYYPNGFRRLVPGDPTLVLDLLVTWSYAYQPCTDLPECTNGVVSVLTF